MGMVHYNFTVTEEDSETIQNCIRETIVKNNVRIQECLIDKTKSSPIKR